MRIRLHVYMPWQIMTIYSLLHSCYHSIPAQKKYADTTMFLLLCTWGHPCKLSTLYNPHGKCNTVTSKLLTEQAKACKIEGQIVGQMTLFYCFQLGQSIFAKYITAVHHWARQAIWCSEQAAAPPSWRILTVVWHGEGWAPPYDIAQDSPYEMTTRKGNIPARSSPGLPRTAPSVTHQDRGVKCTTGVPNKKIRARSNTVTGTWNVRTLEHELTRYNWNTLGQCESPLLKAGQKSTQEGHWLYWSGLEDTHEQGVGFIVHKNTVNCVMNCCPISSRLITIRRRASPFNIIIIQAYAPTSSYSDDDVGYFYEELRNVLDKTPKKDILAVQEDWNAKIGEEAWKDWRGTCGHHCYSKSNDRGRRLLKFASYNNLVVANTFDPH